MTTVQIQKVGCAECKTPVAEIQHGNLLIRSSHLGKKHITVITKRMLDELLEHM
jgi:hypothetical protein